MNSHTLVVLPSNFNAMNAREDGKIEATRENIGTDVLGDLRVKRAGAQPWSARANKVRVYISSVLETTYSKIQKHIRNTEGGDESNAIDHMPQTSQPPSRKHQDKSSTI